MNQLYYGDNLAVLREHIKDETVDLVYLDPPFNSSQDCNVLFEEHGTKAAAQIKVFEDTWEWNTAAAEACASVVEQGGRARPARRRARNIVDAGLSVERRIRRDEPVGLMGKELR